MPNIPIKDKEIKDPFAGMTSKEAHLEPKKVTTSDIESQLMEEFKEPPGDSQISTTNQDTQHNQDGEAKEVVTSVTSFKGNSKQTESTINLTELDESTLLKYPIESKLLADAPAMQIKPKDSSIILRWVYCGALKTDKQGSINVFKYKKLGFEFATVEDIEGGSDMLVDGMLESSGMINNFDTVLMKVNKIRLMQHYKANLLKSYDKVNNALKQAKNAAQREVTSSPAYSKAMSTHPQATVEFYNPVGDK